ncbi:DUF5959 family protein [Streptomyces variabilis]
MLNLIHLADDSGRSVSVRILARAQPGILTGHDFLDAEIVVTGGENLGATFPVTLLPEDLEDWGETLARLEAGEPTRWLDSGRTPSVEFDPPDDRRPPRLRPRRTGNRSCRHRPVDASAADLDRRPTPSSRRGTRGVPPRGGRDVTRRVRVAARPPDGGTGGDRLKRAVLTTVRTGGEPGRSMGGYDPNFAHRPSEMTSTVPSTTLTAVCSSIA